MNLVITNESKSQTWICLSDDMAMAAADVSPKVGVIHEFAIELFDFRVSLIPFLYFSLFLFFFFVLIFRRQMTVGPVCNFDYQLQECCCN